MACCNDVSDPQNVTTIYAVESKVKRALTALLAKAERVLELNGMQRPAASQPIRVRAGSLKTSANRASFRSWQVSCAELRNRTWRRLILRFAVVATMKPCCKLLPCPKAYRARALQMHPDGEFKALLDAKTVLLSDGRHVSSATSKEDTFRAHPRSDT
ncbi:unnamed protein product [Symbiodinium natans]|uniref:Uncharacterized protein n=1 Tax=Symbiodinium natans TaxID=878477 RepID=A0A812MJF5_9DINO|nr:unnamed protein product [Symbiodinium natans]